jgi:hypothetical protein
MPNVQANGHQPIERLEKIEDVLRPMVAREVARQLEPPAKRRWTLNDYLNVAYTLVWWAALFSVGFVIGTTR